MERLFCPICAVNRGHESGVQKVRVSVCERQRELGAQALRRELGAQALRRELGAAACRRELGAQALRRN